MAKVYNISETPLHIRRSLFDLSYSKMFTAVFGKLYPVYLQECLPGDYLKISNEVMARAQPMVAPLMHNVHIDTHYFWVPYRILGQVAGASNPFITMITGFENGVGFSDAQKVVDYDTTGFRATPGINLYNDTDVWSKDITSADDREHECKQTVAEATAKNTLWDFFGFPTGCETYTSRHSPMAFPWFAYNMVCNEYYRDQNLNNPVLRFNNSLIHRAWDKDRFTSALPSAQRGTAPILKPNVSTEWISLGYDSDANTNVFWNGSAYQTGYALDNQSYTGTKFTEKMAGVFSDGDKTHLGNIVKFPEALGKKVDDCDGGSLDCYGSVGMSTDGTYAYTPRDTTDDINRLGLSVTAGINLNDLRLAMALQKWAEKTQRAGSRWTEYLRANFGTAPSDEATPKPVYLGGSKQPLMISEVRSNATTQVTSGGDTKTTVVGDLAGHGLSAGQNFIAKWKAKEPGLIIGLMSIMPKSSYSCQGFRKEWLKLSREDWFNPMFCNLGEQPVLTQELFFDSTDTTDESNDRTFGYQGIYDEYRSREDEVCGNMRDTFSYWHLARSFTSAPKLNPEFIKCDPRKDVFAVHNEDQFIVNVHNIVKAIRPLPALAIPGGLD